MEQFDQDIYGQKALPKSIPDPLNIVHGYESSISHFRTLLDGLITELDCKFCDETGKLVVYKSNLCVER